jgi:hypothetical protein
MVRNTNTMTPKEKAQNLVQKFIQTNGNSFFAKECALIAVDEIIKTFDCTTPQSIDYWQEVKTEIQNL